MSTHTGTITVATIVYTAEAGTVTATVTPRTGSVQVFTTKDGGRFLARLDAQMRRANVLREPLEAGMVATGWVLS
jgi:hypothetical protein